MRRPPSRLQPDVDGTNPFSYARLVQPVLNKYCTECHAKHRDKAMRLDAEPVHVVGKAYMDLPTTYYASYVSLAPQWGFYDYGGAGGRSHRTTPGEFGARASKLYAAADQGPLRREAAARRPAPPDRLARFLLDVLRRVREGRRRSPTPRRSRPAHAGMRPGKGILTRPFPPHPRSLGRGLHAPADRT